MKVVKFWPRIIVGLWKWVGERRSENAGLLMLNILPAFWSLVIWMFIVSNQSSPAKADCYCHSNRDINIISSWWGIVHLPPTQYVWMCVQQEEMLFTAERKLVIVGNVEKPNKKYQVNY